MDVKLIKEQNGWANINIIDIISEKYDKTPTKKLTPLLVKLIKNSINENDINMVHNYFKEKVFGEDEELIWGEFCEHLEMNRLPNKDVTSYSNMKQVVNAVNLVELKMLDKSLSKEIIVVYEDDEWLLIKPLTTESSLKYGYGTRWCTSSKNNPETFFEYSKTGVLIYMINKVNGDKFGFYKRTINKNVSFWNQEDEQVDSITIGMSDVVNKVLINEIENSGNNFDLFSDETKKRYLQYTMEQTKQYDVSEVATPTPKYGYDYDMVQMQA